MKLNRATAQKIRGKSINVRQPGSNHAIRFILMLAVIAATIILINWVNGIGKKAEETISVVMLRNPIHKNQVITEADLIEHSMLLGEFEKYAIIDEHGVSKLRIVKWDDRKRLIGTFAAYPLQSNTLAMFNNFIISRVDNTDTVLYSFPGKEIISLDIAKDALDSFKTFLQPGDRLNIYILYKEIIKEEIVDEWDRSIERDHELFKSELLFGDIMMADLLNSDSQSILDIYTSYNQMTTWQQATLDSDATFIKSVTPNALLVALTPEERDRYLYYIAKQDISFKVTLPQRIN